MSSGVLSRQQTFGTTPTACIRFAALSRIEILHILLEHSYDSQRNENGSARRLHRRQPVAKSQDLLSPLRQFQRRVAVVGSVAHLVAKDTGDLLAMFRGGDRGKIHMRDGQEAVSQVPCWRQQRQDGAALGLATAGPIGFPSTSHTDIVVSLAFSPGRTLVAGGWDKSVRLWDVASQLARAVLVQPIFALVLRAALT